MYKHTYLVNGIFFFKFKDVLENLWNSSLLAYTALWGRSIVFRNTNHLEIQVYLDNLTEFKRCLEKHNQWISKADSKSSHNTFEFCHNLMKYVGSILAPKDTNNIFFLNASLYFVKLKIKVRKLKVFTGSCLFEAVCQRIPQDKKKTKNS